MELTAALADVSMTPTAALLARSAPVLAPTDSLERAAGVMEQGRATHALIVPPSSNSPVGVLSTLDLANALALR